MSAPKQNERLALGAEVCRMATREDNAKLCALFRETPMKSDVDVVFERDPDFFTLYDMQRGQAFPYVCEDAEAKSIEALGTIQFRDAFIEKKKQSVAYLGDLRMTRRVRGGDFLQKYFSVELKKAFEREKCEVGLTAILRKNVAAKFALVRRRKSQPNAPFYKKVRGYSITNVYVLRPKKLKSKLLVRRATHDDLAAIKLTLSDDHKARAFGYDFSGDLLEHRLQKWPGLSLNDFFLAFKDDELVGLCAPYDTQAFKRLRVLSYEGELGKTRRLVNATRLFTGAFALPKEGACFSYKTLTHLYVKHQDPNTFGALFNAVYNAHTKKGVHFLSVYVEEGSPFEQVLDPYAKTLVEADLYTVSLPGSSFNEKEIHEPLGFEMALV